MKALAGLVTSVVAAVLLAPRTLPALDRLVGPAVQATAVTTFALRLIGAGLLAYVALVLLAVMLMQLRLLPRRLRRSVDRWTASGLAGSVRRVVGASTLAVGLLAPTAAHATQAPPVMAPMDLPTAPPTTASPPTAPPPTIAPLDDRTVEPTTTVGRPPILGSIDHHGAPPPVMAPIDLPATEPPTTTRAPSTTRPPAVRPADHRGNPPASPSQRGPAEHARTVTVRPGDSFWSITEALLTIRNQRPPTDPEVIGPWLDLIAANRDVLADPADPDLLAPGAVLTLPT